MSIETYVAFERGWRSLTDRHYVSRFPNANNTGWEPAGAELTPYVGTHFLTEDTVITEKRLDLDALFVGASGILVELYGCEVNGFVDNSVGGGLIIEDSNVNAGQVSNPAVGYDNYQMRRCNVTGGQHSAMGTNDVIVEDNYLHSQYNDPNAGDGYHNNAFICNGGGDLIVRHNTLDCSTELTPNGGGPSGSLSIFGDFSVMHDVLIEQNFFMYTTGSYGVSLGWNPGKPYGDDPVNIDFLDNIFERGITGHNALYGPVTSYKGSEPTNSFLRNYYEDGELVVAA